MSEPQFHFLFRTELDCTGVLQRNPDSQVVKMKLEALIPALNPDPEPPVTNQ
jgi:hypothetical protein